MNIVVDFTCFSDSPKHLYVMDLSDWEYAEDLPSYLKITTPGSKKHKSYTFIKHKTNIFNSVNLGLNCLSTNCTEQDYIDLPDGIYTVSLLSNYEGIDKTKYYLKTDRFEIEFNKVKIKYANNVDENFINYMMRIRYTLEVAKSYISEGNFTECSRYFNEAKKLLRKFSDCNGCL